MMTSLLTLTDSSRLPASLPNLATRRPGQTSANSFSADSLAPNASPNRFGASSELSNAVKPVQYLFDKILNTRTKVMLVEDFLGFGVLRILIDLHRQHILGQKKSETKQQPGQVKSESTLNIAAARERLLREVGSILTDNVSGGLFALGIASAANRWAGPSSNLSNRFVSQNSLQLFEETLKELSPDAFVSQPRFERVFLEALARRFALPENEFQALFYERATNLVSGDQLDAKTAAFLKKINPAAQNFAIKAKKPIAKASLGNGHAFQLQELLADTTHFLGKLTHVEATRQTLQQASSNLLKQSKRVNNWQYAGITMALGLTFSLPLLIQAMTRKIEGFTNYPGDRGIKPMVPVAQRKDESWGERHFPYLSELFKKRSPAALLAFVPLLLALGLVDTRALSRLAFKEMFNAPWKKTFFPKLKEMYQFGKGFPYTTQQQIASCFAFLIFSRMVTARSDVEYRERGVDSALGWATWILGTPILMRLAAKVVEKRFADIQLFNKANPSQSNLLRTQAEIRHFSLPGENFAKSMSASLLIKLGSMLFSIITLGLLEPIIAIKWTAYRAKKSQSALPSVAVSPSLNPSGKSPLLSKTIKPAFTLTTV